MPSFFFCFCFFLSARHKVRNTDLNKHADIYGKNRANGRVVSRNEPIIEIRCLRIVRRKKLATKATFIFNVQRFVCICNLLLN